MRNSKAIVTLAIGEDYQRQWRAVCRANWQEYADKHGYDLICIDKPLDDSERARRRSPAWQKCLVLSQDFSARYERIVWLDADILINHAQSPCVTSGVPVEKVGAVDAWATPTPDSARVALDRLYEYWGDACTIRDYTARDFYASYGLPPLFDQVVRTGVLVLSPRHHRGLLEQAYYGYEEARKDDMRFISFELLKADCVYWIDGRFDPVWLVLKALHYPFLLAETRSQDERGLLARFQRKLRQPSDRLSRRELLKLCLTTAFDNNFFMHFAGCMSEMTLLEASSRRAPPA